MTVDRSGIRTWPTRARRALGHAADALRGWGPVHVGVALGVSTLVAVVIGVATVLIPNSLFTREIAPVWWNYPVWTVSSVLAGMLAATYLRPPQSASSPRHTGDDSASSTDRAAERQAQQPARLATAGSFLTWFAVGCPVCNKIALLALGTSGALTWFAPFQPVLAVAALGLGSVALVSRLAGQVACPLPAASSTNAPVRADLPTPKVPAA